MSRTSRRSACDVFHGICDLNFIVKCKSGLVSVLATTHMHKLEPVYQFLNFIIDNLTTKQSFARVYSYLLCYRLFCWFAHTQVKYKRINSFHGCRVSVDNLCFA